MTAAQPESPVTDGGDPQPRGALDLPRSAGERGGRVVRALPGRIGVNARRLSPLLSGLARAFGEAPRGRSPRREGVPREPRNPRCGRPPAGQISASVDRGRRMRLNPSCGQGLCGSVDAKVPASAAVADEVRPLRTSWARRRTRLCGASPPHPRVGDAPGSPGGGSCGCGVRLRPRCGVHVGFGARDRSEVRAMSKAKKKSAHGKDHHHQAAVAPDPSASPDGAEAGPSKKMKRKEVRAGDADPPG